MEDNYYGLNQDDIKGMFEYQPDGTMLWKIQRASRCKVGTIAGSYNKTTKYVDICLTINGKSCRTVMHRLIYLYHYGIIPKILDHKNGIKNDNRIENLRSATHQQNNFNRKPMSNTGIKNVSYLKKEKMFMVSFKINGKSTSYGRYKTVEEAKEVADRVRKELHGEFANYQ